MVIALFGGRYREGIDLDELNRITTGLVPALEAIPGFISYNFYTAHDGQDLAVVRFESKRSLELWRDDPTHRATWDRMMDFYSEFWVQSADSYRMLLRRGSERTVWEDDDEAPVADLFRSKTDAYGLGFESDERPG
jgi:hypothetical protein